MNLNAKTFLVDPAGQNIKTTLAKSTETRRKKTEKPAHEKA